MTATVAPIAALLFSMALLLMGNGLQGTLLPVRASLEGFAPLSIGVMGSAYFLGFALGCMYGPNVVRRAGHIRTFAAIVAVASSVVLAHAMIVHPVVWWVFRAMTGFCFAVLYMVVESWLNERSTNENRGMVFSLYTVINLTVLTIGQLMLTLDEPGDYPLFLLASILVSLAAVPVAMTRSPAPVPPGYVQIRLGWLYALSPVGVVGCVGAGMTMGSLWALGPLFAQTHRPEPSTVALFMSISVIAGAIGQWPLGLASDRMDRRRIMILTCLGAALAGILMMFFREAFPGAIYVFGFLFGLFAFPLYTLSVAHMNDYVEPDGYVEAAGGLLLLFAIGAVIGPLAGSIAMGWGGAGALFGVTAAVHLAVAGFTIERMRRRARAPEAERTTFSDALNYAQTVSAVDPMATDEDPVPIADVYETEAPEPGVGG